MRLQVFGQPLVVDIHAGPVQVLVLQGVEPLQAAVEQQRAFDVLGLHHPQPFLVVPVAAHAFFEVAGDPARQQAAAFRLEVPALCVLPQLRRLVLPLRRSHRFSISMWWSSAEIRRMPAGGFQLSRGRARCAGLGIRATSAMAGVGPGNGKTTVRRNSAPSSGGDADFDHLEA